MHGSEPSTIENRRLTAACLATGSLIGLAVALLTLDPAFLAGTGGKWIRPENDFMSYVVAWRYYIADEWRFPLFSLPNMGYPEGGSVLFNDALPLSALASKILYRVSGAQISPFGPWIVFAHILQGLMAARLLLAVGNRSTVACAAAASFVVCSTAFIQRMGHTALSSHFLILWALALYFVMVRGRGARIAELTLLLVTALLVNPYLFVMVAVLGAAALFTLWTRDDLRRGDLVRTAFGVLLVLMVGVFAGYGLVFTNPGLMKAPGFGSFSWNVPTLLLPPEGFWGLLGGVSREAVHGQYEGEAYVGDGVLLVLAAVLVWSPRRALAMVWRHWPLCAAFAGLALYAASNRVYAGATLVLSYDLPPVLLELCSYFRASGRFIWPLSYSLAVLPLACLFRWWPPLPASALAIAAALLQVADSRQMLWTRLETSSTPYGDMIGDARLGAWVSSHRRLWIYPSYGCGGLGPANRRWGGPETNRELQIQFLAAQANVPTNSVYTSRMLKDCSAEAAWTRTADLERDVLYLLSLDAVRLTPTLSALETSDTCIPLTWALACSLDWSRTPSDAARAATR
jgi:hypothetical protein